MAYGGTNPFNTAPTGGGTASSLAGVLGAAGGIGAGVSAVFGMFGPSYNPANGGEIRRQLQNSTHGSGSTRRAWTTPGMLDAFVKYCAENYPAVYNGTADIWTTIGSTKLDAWVDQWVVSGGPSATNPQNANSSGGAPAPKNLNTPDVPPDGAPADWATRSGLSRMLWKLTHGKAAWYEYLAALAAVVLVFLLLRWMWRTMTKKGRSGRGKRRARRQRNRQRFGRSMKLR